MRVILLIMQRRIAAQGLMHRLRDAHDVRLFYEPDYKSACETLRARDADTALIEIAETGAYDAHYCLALCDRLRKEKSGCKLLILCPEQDELSVAATVCAKQNGCIDDFLFYDATVDYLASKLLSIS